MDALDLVGIGDREASAPDVGPGDHGGHAEAGAGREIVQQAEHGQEGVEPKSDLLFGLAQGGLDHGLAGVESSAGERPLMGVAGEAGAARRVMTKQASAEGAGRDERG